jgi:thioredoxin reductase (NADPH)
MAVFDAKSGLSHAIAGRLKGDGSLVVVCLCAAWCDTCTAFRASFERIAQARPRELFVWLDIEDDSAICGDIDIENFPTLAVYRGERLLHYGVSLPQEGTVARLIDELATRTSTVADAPQPVLDLPRAMARSQSSAPM